MTILEQIQNAIEEGNPGETEKLVRQAVTEKNWVDLETSLFKLNELTDSFTQMEAKREELCCQICGVSGSQQVPGMHQVSTMLPDEVRPMVREVLHQVRRKLSASKVGNDALNDYIRITKEFLQEVFDSVIPKNRNTVYSNTGSVIKPVPENLLINTVL